MSFDFFDWTVSGAVVIESENSTFLTFNVQRTRNRVSLPNADWFGKGLRHFVFTFRVSEDSLRHTSDKSYTLPVATLKSL